MTPWAQFSEDMAVVGLSVDSPWDFVRSPSLPKVAVPVLVTWLTKADSIPLGHRGQFREGIVRSLAVKSAAALAGPAMVVEFRREPVSPGYRWAVGNTLYVMANRALLEDLILIATESDYGRARQMVVLALGKFKDPRIPDLLRIALEDESVLNHAIAAAGRSGDRTLADDIRPFLDSDSSFRRKSAATALKRLEKLPEA